MQAPSISFWYFATLPSVIKRGLIIGLIVGTILNLINQGDIIVVFAWSEVTWWRVALTYCVPYCVSTYSSAMSLRATALAQSNA
ncbi:MAG: nitrate/nitrite transporter NrtS [Gammaproteobacteria bacterium]|nr:nitrate/nitrite transporter NrtS [Gammaproteobacteria bacterium]